MVVWDCCGCMLNVLSLFLLKTFCGISMLTFTELRNVWTRHEKNRLFIRIAKTKTERKKKQNRRKKITKSTYCLGAWCLVLDNFHSMFLAYLLFVFNLYICICSLLPQLLPLLRPGNKCYYPDSVVATTVRMFWWATLCCCLLFSFLFFVSQDRYVLFCFLRCSKFFFFRLVSFHFVLFIVSFCADNFSC